MTAQRHAHAPTRMRVRRAGIDTYQAPVVYMRKDCEVCRAEGFEALARVELLHDGNRVLATVHYVGADWLAHGEAALSDAAWQTLRVPDGALVEIRHPPVLASLRHIRAKIHGQTLDGGQLREIIQDVAASRLSDLHLAAFVTACAGERMTLEETIGLARAMVDVGQRLSWRSSPVVDKHCVGGLPGNRTTLLVVPIVAACGVLMPKTSSRAITSPAGTADTMETLAPVQLSMTEMCAVVEREGGCVVWGGAVQLSPADDILIRVERPLDLDSSAQLVASVLSKKVAAGAERVVIDIPVGPTAKVRSAVEAQALADALSAVGTAMGLQLRVVQTDGSQPVGQGIGPALEAMDVLAVLQGRPQAPQDLRERALLLAGHLLEMAGRAAAGSGQVMARDTLDTGAAWLKFQAICEAQGGLREPPCAPFQRDFTAPRGGRVARIDNRRIAMAAKLAGAPVCAAAGLRMAVRLGDAVEPAQCLYTLHAQSRGELDYATAYLHDQQDVVALAEGA